MPKQITKRRPHFAMGWVQVKTRMEDMDMQTSKLVLTEYKKDYDEDNQSNNTTNTATTNTAVKYTVGIQDANGGYSNEWGFVLKEMNEITEMGAELLPTYYNDNYGHKLWQALVIVDTKELGVKLWDDWFMPRLIANIMAAKNENL